MESVSIINHDEPLFPFLDLIISRSPNLQILNLQKIEIYSILSFLKLTKLSLEFCRFPKSTGIPNALRSGLLGNFEKLEILKYQQWNDLILPLDIMMIFHILQKSKSTLKSVCLNINLFDESTNPNWISDISHITSYGDPDDSAYDTLTYQERLSNLVLPSLKELIITLTPKLIEGGGYGIGGTASPSDWIVDWDEMSRQQTYFKAPNLENLCLIYQPAYSFDIATFASNVGKSVRNMIVISRLNKDRNSHEAMRFVQDISCLVQSMDEMHSMWIKVDHWPVIRSRNDLICLVALVRALNNVDAVVIRIVNQMESRDESRMLLPLIKNWKIKQVSDEPNTFNREHMIEISKNKERCKEQWIQTDAATILSNPEYFTCWGNTYR